MHREIHQWISPRLNKNMEIVMYGHYGFSLLLLPTAAADYLEYERFHLISALEPYIDAGKLKVYSINSINSEAWLNNKMEPRHKAIRHQQFNEYVAEEVVPFIHTFSGKDAPIITAGASLGALHAANMCFRRPDLFAGTIAMSGVYDLTSYTKGYFDEDVYFNSPTHYLPKLEDENYLSRLRAMQHIHIYSGSGAYEDPSGSQLLSAILASKGIPHDMDIWGPDMRHDWPTWRAMLPYIIGSKF
jgi:esterase/lipase superfamily enzyme